MSELFLYHIFVIICIPWHTTVCKLYLDGYLNDIIVIRYGKFREISPLKDGMRAREKVTFFKYKKIPSLYFQNVYSRQ
jgi:hypothetical protein